MNRRERVLDIFRRLEWAADVSDGQQVVDDAIAQAKREILLMVGQLPKDEPLIPAMNERWG